MSPRRASAPTTAIDLQPHSVDVTVLESTKDAYRARAGHRDLEDQGSADELTQHAASALQDLLDELDAPRERAAIHTHDQTTTLLTAELPPLKPKDLPDAIRAHLLVTLPRGIDGLSYRYVETRRTRTNVHALILATPNAHLEWLNAVAREAGVALVHAQPRIISLAHAYLAFDPEPETTTLLVHVGGHRANIALLHQGTLELARITNAGTATLAKRPEALRDELLATLELHEPNGTHVIPTVLTGLSTYDAAAQAVASDIRFRLHEPRLDGVRFTNGALAGDHLPDLGLAHAASSA